jgi:hypothetical protein
MIGYTRWTGFQGGILCESDVNTVWQHIREDVDNGEGIEGGILCESEVINVWQHIADSMVKGEMIEGGILCESAKLLFESTLRNVWITDRGLRVGYCVKVQ